MVNWSAQAPVNPEKPDWLHDQSQLPSAPPRSASERVRGFMPVFLGLLFGAGMVALAFQTRASWDWHRDWVVPTTVPLTVAGGVALAYLVVRRAWLEMMPGLFLLLITLTLTGLNIWRGAVTEGDDALRDALSITTGVFLGLTVVALVVAMIWVESTRPTRAPQPEM